MLLVLLSTPSPDSSYFFFFFNDTATTEIYTLSLHDALPISPFQADTLESAASSTSPAAAAVLALISAPSGTVRSEEHTSELQSHSDLVCRLLLEKKKNELTSHSESRQPFQRP